MEEIWSFKVLFFSKYCIKVVAFVWFIFLMFWRNMIFQSTLFCKYRITVGALVRFIFLMFRRNMIFQITLGTTNVFCNFSFLWTFSTCFFRFLLDDVCNSRISLFFHVQTKYDLLNLYFLQILHHSLGIYSHVQKKQCHFNLTYCKYCITVWAFLSFIGRNMIFQSPLFLQILHQSLCICMVYFSYDLKKYDLSKYSFLQISHHSLGIS